MSRFRIGRIVIDLRDLSIGRKTGSFTHEWFALRCGCGDLTLGCKHHWFCGLCESCRQSYEDAG